MLNLKPHFLLKKISKYLDIGIHWLINIMDSIVERKGYKLNWLEIKHEFEKSGIEDYVEFATSYTFYWHETNGKQDDGESKLRMHREIVEGLLIRQGETF